jgi:hypothetical protein
MRFLVAVVASLLKKKLENFLSEITTMLLRRI